ncbi:hypothetical protein [Halegenticoccus soli]|uniref:hypothetical protein n=1 Tax=Halegenticoccus soli TaxID=1985678 RepID=UPI000C6DE717|nr:hypothetical protein [Halegenticoccus soli]
MTLTGIVAFLSVLQSAVLSGLPLGRAFAVLVAVGVVVLVGRLVLRVAWRVVTVGAVVVGALLLLSMLGAGI